MAGLKLVDTDTGGHRLSTDQTHRTRSVVIKALPMKLHS